MRVDEFGAFLAQAKASYADDMVRAGITREAAEAKSDRDHLALLPDGLESERQFLFVIEHDGEPAGYLWLAERAGDFGADLFVYGVHVDESRRGRGLGRAAMEFAEAEARRRGLPKVALNVFGGNEVAHGLYRSLGYRETAIYMEKQL
jgi:ribosomal protein S18 acetylase RimI-like enzyme